MVITIKCVFCGKPRTIYCKDSEYEEYKCGELIQIAMPNMSADDREMLISQICPKCWDKTFCNRQG